MKYRLHVMLTIDGEIASELLNIFVGKKGVTIEALHLDSDIESQSEPSRAADSVMTFGELPLNVSTTTPVDRFLSTRVAESLNNHLTSSPPVTLGDLIHYTDESLLGIMTTADVLEIERALERYGYSLPSEETGLEE